jgi:N-methylhydantoinase A/oxoprolinase/acetone carboxylase beta subunit
LPRYDVVVSGRFLLGIDTGGTYTDAVIFDEETSTVVAKAKAPTTHDELSVGILGATDRVLTDSAVAPQRIDVVSLSTTLATNALVEGKGRAVCSVIVGFEAEVLDRAGLPEAMGKDPVVLLNGGHDSHGYQIEPLDLDALGAALGDIAEHVDAFAVTSQFSVRNPAHELTVAAFLRERTGRPVTMSHHLSAQLNGPKRAVTAVLNARLIAIVEDLVDTTEQALRSRGITAPLMVVRGDGSLVSAAFVRERPIETILSGPAASLVGAAHLTSMRDGIISDIGGTTTDIAVVRSGLPLVSQDGATVGGHKTMVTAVAMDTHGLGGDSEVRHDDRVAGPQLLIGPRRVVPLCVLARSESALVTAMLTAQLASETPDEFDGVILLPTRQRHRAAVLDSTEQSLIDSLGQQPAIARDVLNTAMKRRALARLVGRGLIQLSSFTPTDASHVLGLQHTDNAEIADLAASLFARRKDRLGNQIATDAAGAATLTIDSLVRRSAEAVLAAALQRDGLPAASVATPIVQAALNDAGSLVQLAVRLSVPLVGLGASAGTYYPRVGALLHSDVIVPEHADVANAIGAVVGRVRITREMLASAPQLGQFLVHAGIEPVTVLTLDEARALAHDAVLEGLRADMEAAGASEYDTEWDWQETTVDVGGIPMFVEGKLTATGTGRPQLS